MNPYDPPESNQLGERPSQSRDVGALLVAAIMFIGFVVSAVSFFSPAIRDFVMPRFGWGGLLYSLNSLIFIGSYVGRPTRRGLFAAGFVTTMIGVINGLMLLRSGTVDSVQNVFHDRLHSAWVWSVASYLAAGGYFAFVAFRNREA